MEWTVWEASYKRLCRAKAHTINGDECAAYYEALQEFPDACVMTAVLAAVQNVKGWPKTDQLVDLARKARRDVTHPAQHCQLCHGDGWVDTPDEERFNRMYSNFVKRCPQCYPQARTTYAEET